MDSKSKKILAAFKKQGARIETKARVKLRGKKDFSLWYTPGVGAASLHLAKRPKDARALSIKGNSVAIISDGSAVLGLGNIGPYGALPVMEGKALIFKERAGIDAWPLVLATQDPDEIVSIVKAVAPAFGGVNLEDIAAPKCFEIEKRLVAELDVPVMHDDQHGTAIAVLAALLNAVKVVRKEFASLSIVISGAGAAGIATANLIRAAGARNIILLDRAGTLYKGRSSMNPHKARIASRSNPRRVKGGLTEAIAGADVFIGLSGKGLLTKEHVRSMAKRSIVFAMANPDPEILPRDAKAAGASVVGTGRSDFPNQINNSLVFPGIFRGALDRGVTRITEATKLRAARALASLVVKPTSARILPDMLDPRVVKAVAQSVK